MWTDRSFIGKIIKNEKGFTSCVFKSGLVVSKCASLVPITWTAYGLTFEAPKGILVEEDTEETFLLNNSRFYITIQSLDSDGMTKSDLKSVLKDYANDDGVKDQSAVQEFELLQFFGTYLKGSCETDHCLYACLMTKAAGSGFYISIIYSKENENIAEKILKSFTMEE